VPAARTCRARGSGSLSSGAGHAEHWKYTCQVDKHALTKCNNLTIFHKNIFFNKFTKQTFIYLIIYVYSIMYAIQAVIIHSKTIYLL